jgi:hypothetical protein
VRRQRGPAGLRKAGRRKLTATDTAIKVAPRPGVGLVEAVMAAIDEQTVVVPGTAAAETVDERGCFGYSATMTVATSRAPRFNRPAPRIASRPAGQSRGAGRCLCRGVIPTMSRRAGRFPDRPECGEA